MKILMALLLITLLSCNAAPEPLQYGQDACHTCKMTLMDKKFGAELVTSKGKVYKFDDINCMITFYHSGQVETTGFAHKLVVDFNAPSTLINAPDAFYLKSPEIKTPMASQVAGFSTKESMEQVKKEVNGIYLVWGELVTQYKK
jgi:copper chaperone NosL